VKRENSQRINKGYTKINNVVNFKLIPYTIRIEHEEEKDDLILDDLRQYKRTFIEEFYKSHPKSLKIEFTQDQLDQLKKTDFLYIIQEYFNTIKDPFISNEYQKTITLEKFEEIDRHLYGVIKGGEFGIRADHLDIVKKVRKKDARKKTDSEELPFFFHFYIPNDQCQGYVILESIGNHAIETQLEDHLNKFLVPMKYSISFSRMVSKNFIDLVNTNDLKKIRLIKRIVPKDTAEKVHDGDPHDIIEERIFKATRNKKIILTDYLKKNFTNKEITQYEILNDHFSEIKAEIKQQKILRTATFSPNNAHIGELMYLGDIALENDHPRYDAIKNQSLQYMTALTDNT
jgi:hypothetical protein